MRIVKILFWLIVIGVALFFLFHSIMPFWIAFLWTMGLVGWLGFVLVWLSFTHQIHWLEDKMIQCPQCHHKVDVTFLDGKPVFQRKCPYCGFDLAEHHSIFRGGR